MKQRFGHPVVLRLVTLAAAASPILALDAHAGDPPKIVISQSTKVGDRATSRVDPAWVETRLGEKLDARLAERYTVSRATGCGEMDPPCSLARARRRHADYLVRATQESELGDHRVVLAAVRPEDGQTVVSVEETCEICGRGELEGFLDNVVGTLLARLDAVSQPVDSLEPVTLPPVQTRSPALKIAGWTTLGAGAGAAITGAILWGLDGRPHRASCDTPDDAGRCPNMYSSRRGGIALTAVGLTAVGVGAALLVVDRVRDGQRDRRASARVRFDGASLSWSF